uniref:Uncharacterized protein n=1 Tax=Schlesneria paludicola TaxID=360056 RepID=A0A7C4LLR2_9PLAN
MVSLPSFADRRFHGRSLHTAAHRSHAAAEQSHAAAHRSHAAAEPSHAVAEQSHTAAEQSHTAAEQSHTAAEQSHAATHQIEATFGSLCMRYLLLTCLCVVSSLPACVRPVPPAVPVADYFEALADDLPEQSDELLWVVERLAHQGRLSSDDLHDFHAAFPGLKTRNRPLTEHDRTALRGLR